MSKPRMIPVVCAYCKMECLRHAGHVNRSSKQGYPVYCGRKCSGLNRRKYLSPEEKKERKRLYDVEYRAKNLEMLKQKKRRYFEASYDPVAAAVKRKARMPYHVEYCRQPEYRKRKVEYDRKLRAKKQFSEFADAFLILQDIEREVLSRMTHYEIAVANDTVNKHTRRRREYERITGQTIR